MQTLDRSNALLKTGKAHFHFQVGDRKIAYCYIRKNACSSFKDMICATSKHIDKTLAGSDQLKFLQEHHRIRTARQLQRCDLKVFVYRDPYERLISVFINKFVARSANGSIFRNYGKMTGKAPETTTFRDFVTTYCVAPFQDRDPHIYPQAMHLLPVRYNAAINMSGLHGDIRELLGQDIADRFFLHKKNSSNYGTDESLHLDTSSADLNTRFQADGTLPATACFDDPALREHILQSYTQDYELLRKLS